jgi:hypothetical protein
MNTYIIHQGVDLHKKFFNFFSYDERTGHYAGYLRPIFCLLIGHQKRSQETYVRSRPNLCPHYGNYRNAEMNFTITACSRDNFTFSQI